jgi:hypothetical protein
MFTGSQALRPWWAPFWGFSRHQDVDARPGALARIPDAPLSTGFLTQMLPGTALAMLVSRIFQIAGLLVKMAITGQVY